MELGSGPPVSSSGPSSPLFNDEDPKEAAAGAGVFGIFGGMLGGFGAAAGAAAVTFSLPGLIAGAAAGAAVYGTGVGVKWTFKKVRRMIRR